MKNMKVLLLAYVAFLIGCQENSNEIIWSYRKASTSIELKHAINFSFLCNSDSEVVTLNDVKGEFFRDTISGLSTLNSLNCQINTDNAKRLYDYIYVDQYTYNIDILKASYLYRTVVDKFAAILGL